MNHYIYLLLFFYSTISFAVELKFVTEDLPPLQYNNHGKPASGAMVDLIHLLKNEAKLSGSIYIYPWARSYQMAKNEENVIIFSMFRSADREKHFQWVGKIYRIDSYLVALKSRQDIRVNNLNDAKAYTVGSIRDDLAENYLKERGFIEDKNLYLSSAYPVLWKMLYSGRTDLAFTNSLVWQYEIQHSGLDPNKIKFIYKIPDIPADLYIAASLPTKKNIVEKLQQALQRIKADGRYQKILTQWQL